MIGDDHLVIEGNVHKTNTEEQMNISKASEVKQSFKRHFYLPGQVNLRDAQSKLSNDGVLTIALPKQVNIFIWF